MPPQPGDGREEFQPLAKPLGFFFQLEFAADAALVDHVGVEAIVGAVAIDHVFVGGAVELFGLVVVPRFFVVIVFVVGEGQVFGVVFVQIVVVGCESAASGIVVFVGERSPIRMSGTCQ